MRKAQLSLTELGRYVACWVVDSFMRTVSPFLLYLNFIRFRDFALHVCICILLVWWIQWRILSCDILIISIDHWVGFHHIYSINKQSYMLVAYLAAMLWWDNKSRFLSKQRGHHHTNRDMSHLLSFFTKTDQWWILLI